MAISILETRSKSKLKFRRMPILKTRPRPNFFGSSFDYISGSELSMGQGLVSGMGLGLSLGLGKVLVLILDMGRVWVCCGFG